MAETEQCKAAEDQRLLRPGKRNSLLLTPADVNEHQPGPNTGWIVRLFRPKGHFRPRVLLPRSDTPALEVVAFGAPASRKSQPERAGTVETCGHLWCNQSLLNEGLLHGPNPPSCKVPDLSPGVLL